MNITTVGIDLAKNVFQVDGVDARGKVVLRRQLRREQVARFFVNLPPCLVGMESCASARHWGRTLDGFGHAVRLMAPQFVKPCVKIRGLLGEKISNSSRPHNYPADGVKRMRSPSKLIAHRSEAAPPRRP